MVYILQVGTKYIIEIPVVYIVAEQIAVVTFVAWLVFVTRTCCLDWISVGACGTWNYILLSILDYL